MMLNLDAEQIDNFKVELDNIYKKACQNLSNDDFIHLKKIVRWGRLSSFFGIASGILLPNPISAFLISLGRFTRWTMVAHHVFHRGYDKVPGASEPYKSTVFAKGWRRYIDWFDWMVPEAWDVEHNILHHYNLNELADPDLVEESVKPLIRFSKSLIIRSLSFLIFALTWRILYYPWSTWKQLVAKKEFGRVLRLENRLHPNYLIDLIKHPIKYRKFILACWIPYFFFNFVLLPAIFYSIHPWMGVSIFANIVLAEAFTNIHSFLVIGPNHSGSDLFRFYNSIKSKGEFYLHQIHGSTNYRCGSDMNDFLHGWLNYQIEHHLWPNLSMLQYKRIHPEVKAVCIKYNIPYRQESLFKRVVKMYKIFIGVEKMATDE